MQAAEYCFAPAGDTPTSSRLYSSLAAGCVPVVLADSADEDVFPFPASLDWSEIAVVAPILTDRTDVAELAAMLRAEGPEAREKRRDAGAAAFDNHLDYIGNARGVADAFLRELAAAREHRAELEKRRLVSREPEPKRPPGLRAGGGGGGDACPTVALLLGHPRSGTTALEELLFLRKGAHVVDEPLAAFQTRAPKYPISVDKVRAKLTGSARTQGFATLGGALACNRTALMTLLDHDHGFRQFTHAIPEDLFPEARACRNTLLLPQHEQYRRKKCLSALAGPVLDRWAGNCAATAVRASKVIRLNGQLGQELLLENDITTVLRTSLGCAPRIAVITIVRHPADVLFSNYETPGLEGIERGTIRMPPQPGIRTTDRYRFSEPGAGRRRPDVENTSGAEGEAMCLETLQDVAAGAVLRHSGPISRNSDVAETTDAWRLIRYQDFVQDPDAVAKDIHSWLGLPPAPPHEHSRGLRRVFGAFSKAYSTERRAQFTFGDACDEIVPTRWDYTPPSCALVIADLELERVCGKRRVRARLREERLAAAVTNPEKRRKNSRLRGAKERLAAAAANPEAKRALCMELQKWIKAGKGQCKPGQGMFCNALGKCFTKGACTLCETDGWRVSLM